MGINIALTGASGNMGQATLECFLTLDFVDHITLLLEDKKREHKLIKKLNKEYKDKFTYILGTINNQDNCDRLVKDVSYVFHLAAIIPPMADHDFKGTHETNNLGVKCLIKAIEKLENQPKLIHISTVGIYGNRDYHHPWGRVGDPLLPSAYDVYSIEKLKGERAVLESHIKTWVVLRQSGVLHKNLLKDNISDGLLFHTPYNVPIEWVTAHDSGVLLMNLLKTDYEGTLDKKFWKNVYNIGGGKDNRVTGYETFQEGFGIIGVTTESFMKPNWNATRNFHCMWYLDSDQLENYFHFQSETIHSFWQDILNSHKYFKLAKIVPARLLSKMVLGPLLKDENAPYHWVKIKSVGRVTAAFGSMEDFEKLPKEWKDFNVFCKNKGWNGEDLDYNDMKDFAKSDRYKLNHGYDENKPDNELDIEDMKMAASFRGGKLISTSMKKGDLYTPLEWETYEGKRFLLSPFAVLKAGHWEPIDELPEPWNYDELSKHNPFYAQIWYDTHKNDEDYRYYHNDKEEPIIDKI